MSPKLVSDHKDMPSLSPLERKYLNMTETSADRIVRAVLSSCHIPEDQVTILIQKGRIHSLRKILLLTEEKWVQMMSLSEDLSLVDFKSILQF